MVTNHLKVAKLKIINAFLFGIDFEFRKGPRFPGELLFQSIHVIEINMRITNDVNKFSRLSSRHVSHHVCQKSITRNIEGNSEAHVGTALIELAGKFVRFNIHLIKQREHEQRLF